MKVNKKKLAEIFGVDVRTITTWQSQGLTSLSGGGKGTESIFNTVEVIAWRAEREHTKIYLVIINIPLGYFFVSMLY